MRTEDERHIIDNLWKREHVAASLSILFKENQLFCMILFWEKKKRNRKKKRRREKERENWEKEKREKLKTAHNHI